MMKEKVVLLLSGGKDSALCLRLLLESNYEVIGLCISGIQKKEEIGAKTVAEKCGIKLDIVQVPFFDEETWNPFKLIIRDLAMGAVAIAKCKLYQSRILATGVKSADINNPKLKWLKYFLSLAKWVLSIFGIQLIFPLIDSIK